MRSPGHRTRFCHGGDQEIVWTVPLKARANQVLSAKKRFGESWKKEGSVKLLVTSF
jgi:hypothetical protein